MSYIAFSIAIISLPFVLFFSKPSTSYQDQGSQLSLSLQEGESFAGVCGMVMHRISESVLLKETYAKQGAPAKSGSCKRRSFWFS